MQLAKGASIANIQLLSFFKMAFSLFALSAILATVVLMPFNLFVS